MTDVTQYRLLPLELVRSPFSAYRAPLFRAPADVLAEIQSGALPSEVDLDSIFPAIKDQGAEGSCTGQATSSLLSHLYARVGKGMPAFSAAFAYYLSRALHGWQNQDSGAYEADELASGVQNGICYESFMPYVAGQFTTAPSADAYADAKNHRFSAYQSLPGWQWVCQSLGGDRRGCTISTNFYQEWYQTPAHGVLVRPSSSPIGGHEMAVCGYKYFTSPYDGVQALHVRAHNSWGPFGDQGHLWFDTRWMDTVVTEHWTAQAQIEANVVAALVAAAGGASGVVATLSVASPAPNDLLIGVEGEFVRFGKLLAAAGADIPALVAQIAAT